MENFFENDSSFELQSSLDGENLLNNRVLTTYPSEKSSFQVFLGADGSGEIREKIKSYRSELLALRQKRDRLKQKQGNGAEIRALQIPINKLKNKIAELVAQLGSSGFDGDGDYSYFEYVSLPITTVPEPPKGSGNKIDPEKLSGAITAGVGAIGAVASTVQAFKGDGTSRRKQLKEVCGRRPILARKRESSGWNKCEQAYNANLLGGTRSTTTQNDTPPAPSEAELKAIADAEKKARNTKIIIGSLIVVAVGVTAFIAYKKGLFSSK
jgi:hypothetical protein